MRRAILLAVAGLVAAAVFVPAHAAKVKNRGLEHLGLVKYEGGTELAAHGDYVYAGQLNGGPEYPSRNTKPKAGGVHVIDVSGGAPKEVGFLHCPGNDNDVEVVKPGLIALGHHANECNTPKQGESAHGLMLIDVSNPTRPNVVGDLNLPSGAYSHTIRPYPGEDIIYVNPGGLPTNGRTIEHIVDVSKPTEPKVVATWSPGVPTGCHDFSFHITKKAKLGFCAGYGATAIVDVSNPLEPEVISRIVNPRIEFHHYAVASSDGKLLAIDDEAFAFHECRSGNSPTGRAWFYDISDPASPSLVSSYAPPRGGDQTGIGHYLGWIPSWCLSHGLDWQPGTHNIAVTWFSGGFSVLAVAEGDDPLELAYFQAPDSATYSALWHDGVLYTNDTARGVDAFEFKMKSCGRDSWGTEC